MNDNDTRSKYVPFLDEAGCDLNEPGLYLPPRGVTPNAWDRCYYEALADWEAELSDAYAKEKALNEEFENRGLLDAHDYLYGEDAYDVEEGTNELESEESRVDALFHSRFSAKHVREARRKASLEAKTRKIALGMPEVTKEYRTVLGITTSVHQKAHSARSMLNAHFSARASIAKIRDQIMSVWLTGRDTDRFISLSNYYSSFLLSGPQRIVADVEFIEDGRAAIPVYGMSGHNEFLEFSRLARKGKALFKLAKHYDGFSPKKGHFFTKPPKKGTSFKVEAPQDVVKGPKKLWTQEEIAAAKIAEACSERKHKAGFVKAPPHIAQNKSFDKKSKRNTRSVTPSELILVPCSSTPLIHNYMRRDVMCYHPC